MKVKELIGLLSKENPEAVVFMYPSTPEAGWGRVVPVGNLFHGHTTGPHASAAIISGPPIKNDQSPAVILNPLRTEQQHIANSR